MRLYSSLPREGCPRYQGFKEAQAELCGVPSGCEYQESTPGDPGTKNSMPGVENSGYRNHAHQAKGLYLEELSSYLFGPSQQPLERLNWQNGVSEAGEAVVVQARGKQGTRMAGRHAWEHQDLQVWPVVPQKHVASPLGTRTQLNVLR